MSTVRKELEFPAPPEGWEIDRYGYPSLGDFCHVSGGWLEAGVDAVPLDMRRPYLIARKKQSPAEWANAQPDLAALARILDSDSHLYLYQSGSHEMGRDCPCVNVPGFTGPNESRIEIQDGKWKDVQ